MVESGWGCPQPVSLSILFLLRTVDSLNCVGPKWEQLSVIMEAGYYPEGINRDWNIDFNLKKTQKIHLTKLVVWDVSSSTLWPILGEGFRQFLPREVSGQLKLLIKWLQFTSSGELTQAWGRQRSVPDSIFQGYEKKVHGSFGDMDIVYARVRVRKERQVRW